MPPPQNSSPLILQSFPSGSLTRQPGHGILPTPPSTQCGQPGARSTVGSFPPSLSSKIHLTMGGVHSHPFSVCSHNRLTPSINQAQAFPPLSYRAIHMAIGMSWGRGHWCHHYGDMGVRATSLQLPHTLFSNF